MIRITFTEEQVAQLRYERFHHPHPRVQAKMEALLLKSEGLPHEEEKTNWSLGWTRRAPAVVRCCSLTRHTLSWHRSSVMFGASSGSSCAPRRLLGRL